MQQEINDSVNQSFIRQIGGLRITQEEIIVQNEQTQNTIQSVLCPVCLCVLSLPHWSCQKCENVFCKECLQNWWIKSPNTCIFKCEEAQFKMVKRSHAFRALMQILKVRCKMCGCAVPIASISSHYNVCPKKLMECTFQGCPQIIFRSELEQHLKNCQFRKVECNFCSQLFLIGAIENHKSNLCEERPVKCMNKGCDFIQKAKIFQQHQKICEFIEMKCEWCKQMFPIKDFKDHENECNQRDYQCEWCEQHFKGQQYKDHKNKCIEIRVVCQLCKHHVREIDYKEHKFECMFNEMVKVKQSEEQLIAQNTKLKQKINELQYNLEELSKNRHQATLKSFIQIKQEQKKQLERDLIRIKNSLQSIRKMRNEQLSEHQKKIHFSTSLCVFCNTIRKKMQDEMEPLLKLHEEITHKIKQIERTEYATRQSIIRIAEQ